jgi:prepilin-type N-terminal cleavage/methylation domain-containing protein
MRGYTLLELLFTIAIGATLVGIAVPLTTGATDEIRTGAAARYLATAIVSARIDAVKRSTAVGWRFEPQGQDVLMSLHADGNGNGVRSAEILSGVDRSLGGTERLDDRYPGVRFGLLPGIADLDGAMGVTEGVRIGVARILSLSPTGGATSGTLYLHGRRSQYAVRVLGATGRVRVFHYNPGARQWNSK